MLKRYTLRKAHHGVYRVLCASQARCPSFAPYHTSSTKTSRQQEHVDTDALNETLDSALAGYDEADPFREFKKQGSGSRPNADLLTEQTHFERDSPDNPSLPLPPFLRNKKLDKSSKMQSSKIEAIEEVKFGRSDVPKLGRIIRDQYQSRGERKRKAPFSTRFAENPWARALATPVRECRKTAARVPTGCLIDFHLVESAEPKDGQKAGGKGEKGTLKPTKMELMPITMALDLIPTKSKYRKWSEEGQMLQKLVRQATLRRKPHGIASYLASHYAILKSISERVGRIRAKDKAGFVKRFIASRLVGNVMERKYGSETQLGWRTDMADYVLKGLRALVIKRLRYWMLRKEDCRIDGNVTQIIGGGMLDQPGSHGGLHGWQGVEMVNDVICVLRLRPETDHDTESLDSAQIATSSNQPAQTDLEQSILDRHHTRSTTEEEDRPLLEEDRTNQLTPTPSLPVEDTTTNSEFGEAEERLPFSSTPKTQSDSETDSAPYKQTDSPTYVKPDSAFQSTSHTPQYLLDLMPLPPDRRPLSIYYPTLPYRGRRIPLYDLYHLLGPDITEDVLKGTAFSNSRYVAVKTSLGTFNLITALSKLTGYLGTSKTEFLTKMEQQQLEYARQANRTPESVSPKLA